MAPTECTVPLRTVFVEVLSDVPVCIGEVYARAGLRMFGTTYEKELFSENKRIELI